ncbi:MAG TPA: hypothetical protein PKI20_12840 [Verrucomicrobiota bacterium]|nr:hypothetical protein [Verrucomicrobiota bacterium]HQL78959.1 hypothetical protein [Verrucomicrobiota bacterium]
MIAHTEPAAAGATALGALWNRPRPSGRVSDCCRILAGLLALTTLASFGRAQSLAPRIGYVYPAGGRQGATVQVAIGGQYLNNAGAAFVSGAGVEVKVGEYTRPLNQKEFNNLRDQLKELQSKRAAASRAGKKRKAPAAARSGTNVVWTAADERAAAEIRRKLFLFAPRRNQNPAIAETVTLRVTVSANAAPGDREIRLATPGGLSNPLRFCIGQLPEFTKRTTTTVPDEATLRQRRFSNEQKAAAPTEMRITLPAVVNGQILPGGVDRYRFTARKGLRLVVAASARELIPYLPDAVPGWFQAALALYDASGRELAHADHYLFHPDPVLCYEIPRDGEYIAEIRDSIYRGREDFVYRITLGEVPYLTRIYPLGGSADAQTTVELKGWNLPLATLTRTNGEPGIYPLTLRGQDRIVNNLPFAVDALPECSEKEPNDTLVAAQPVTLPVIVNGRIGQPGEWDVFRVKGRPGDTIVAEVHARRLDSPLDSVLKLTDAAGKQLAFNDDHEDKGAGLDTHFADAYLTAALPAEGTCYVHVGDAQRQGGAEFAYRLRISPPQPDFALRVVPSSLNIRAGAAVPLTVFALRRDGFTNEITLSLVDAPSGFKLNGASIPANQDQVRLTLQAPPAPTEEPARLFLEGRAFVRGRPLVHPAIPAEDMMQAFAYRHLVPARELAVNVTGRSVNRTPLKILSATPVKIPAGGTARVRFSTPGGGAANRFGLELNEPPEGIALGKVSPARDGTEIELCSDAAKARPGLKGNLIISIVSGQVPAAAAKKQKAATQKRAAVGTLPAIPFEITQPSKVN